MDLLHCQSKNCENSYFCYEKWNSEIIGYLTVIHEARGKQSVYMKQKPQELDKLVEIDPLHSLYRIMSSRTRSALRCFSCGASINSYREVR